MKSALFSLLLLLGLSGHLSQVAGTKSAEAAERMPVVSCWISVRSTISIAPI